uniref:Transposase n=1 Tax=Panagrellus redivivus TaxID=6233 RepID=A0A7E4V9A4_PANRE
MSLDVSYNDHEQDIFDFNEFLAFIKAQRPGFRIVITDRSSSYGSESTFSELKTYLDQKLVRSYDPLKKRRTLVFMSYSTLRCMWYLPNDNDLRRASKRAKQTKSDESPQFVK